MKQPFLPLVVLACIGGLAADCLAQNCGKGLAPLFGVAKKDTNGNVSGEFSSTLTKLEGLKGTAKAGWTYSTSVEWKCFLPGMVQPFKDGTASEKQLAFFSQLFFGPDNGGKIPSEKKPPVTTDQGGYGGATPGAEKGNSKVAPTTPTSVTAPGSGLESPRTAKIAIASIPVDHADINIDGKFRGQTPSTVDVDPGEHQVVVKKPGFVPWERTLTVTGGDITLNAELDKLKVSLPGETKKR